MPQSNSLPLSLKVVAVLFVVAGIGSVIEILVSLSVDRLRLNFGFVGVFIGAGLLRKNANSRSWALLFIWIYLITAPVIAVVFFLTPAPIHFSVFGQQVSDASRWLAILFVLGVFLLAVWQYRVLTHGDVKALFTAISPQDQSDREKFTED